MKDKGNQAGWGFWLGWVLASTVGWFVGFSLSFVLGSAIVEGVFGGEFSVLESILSGLIGGAAVGAVAGILQWLVLRRRVSRAGWWVLASTVGWGLCAAVAGAGLSLMEFPYETWTPTLLLLVGGGVVLGAVTGGALVWLLRQPIPEAQLE